MTRKSMSRDVRDSQTPAKSATMATEVSQHTGMGPTPSASRRGSQIIAAYLKRDESDSPSKVYRQTFGIPKTPEANWSWLDMGKMSQDKDAAFSYLKAHVAPVQSSHRLSTDTSEKASRSDVLQRDVAWSLFDLFENDLPVDSHFEEPRLLIRACSYFAELSRTCQAFIGAYSAWYGTLLACFLEVLESDPWWSGWPFHTWYVADLALDVVFFVLTLCRLFTTVLDPLTAMETCDRRLLVRWELRKSGFWLDLITCLPWTTLVLEGTISNAASCVKAVRIRHMFVRSPIFSLFRRDIRLVTWMLLLVLLAGHALSCVYFLMIHSTGSNARHPYFTAQRHSSFTGFGFGDHYMYSLRSAVYLVLGADLEGYSIAENCFILMFTPLGVLVNMLVFSQIIVVKSRRSALQTEESEENTKTLHAMNTLGLPSVLQFRIFCHYAYERAHKSHRHVANMLGGLPEELNFELHLARHYALVTAVPFFSKAQGAVLKEIVLSLSDVTFLPGDFVCRHLDEGKEMYFIQKGRCSVIANDRVTMLKTVHEGEYFGEISLLTGVQRTAYVRADTFCQVAELHKDNFDQICKKFPKQLEIIVSGFSEEQKSLLLSLRQRLQIEENLCSTRAPARRSLAAVPRRSVAVSEHGPPVTLTRGSLRASSTSETGLEHANARKSVSEPSQPRGSCVGHSLSGVIERPESDKSSDSSAKSTTALAAQELGQQHSGFLGRMKRSIIGVRLNRASPADGHDPAQGEVPLPAADQSFMARVSSLGGRRPSLLQSGVRRPSEQPGNLTASIAAVVPISIVPELSGSPAAKSAMYAKRQSFFSVRRPSAQGSAGFQALAALGLAGRRESRESTGSGISVPSVRSPRSTASDLSPSGRSVSGDCESQDWLAQEDRKFFKAALKELKLASTSFRKSTRELATICNSVPNAMDADANAFQRMHGRWLACMHDLVDDRRQAASVLGGCADHLADARMSLEALLGDETDVGLHAMDIVERLQEARTSKGRHVQGHSRRNSTEDKRQRLAAVL